MGKPLLYFQVFDSEEAEHPIDDDGANFALCPRHALERGYFGVEMQGIAGKAEDGQVLRRVPKKEVVAHLKAHGINDSDPDCEDCHV